MRVLFVHHRFPGQFVHWARYLSKHADVDVRVLRARLGGSTISATRQNAIIEYEPANLSSEAEGHALRRTLQAAANSYNCMYAAKTLKEQGWIPDVIYCHTGWAPSLFLRDIFPHSKIVKYLEWYYNADGSDADFLEPYSDLQHRLATRIMNLPLVADIVDGDTFISPTEWQKQQFPSLLESSIRVIPDGIDTEYFRPNKDARFVLEGGRVLTRADRVVTYAARGADPYRGFQSFIAALQELQRNDSTVEAVISGDRMVHYGAGAGTCSHFEDVMGSAKLDMARTHFVGFLPLERHLSLLQVSRVHVYLTVPFVLSWSMLEAMSVGCCVIASDTAPVQEFVTNDESGILVNFFDTDAISEQIRAALDDHDVRQSLGAAARDTVKHRWGLKLAMEAHLQHLKRTLGSVPMQCFGPSTRISK
jgi:glycosyltransferase involved in cell wall biosynthesis